MTKAEHLDEHGNHVAYHEWLPDGSFEPSLTLGPGESVIITGEMQTSADFDVQWQSSGVFTANIDTDDYAALEQQRDECSRRGKMWARRSNWTLVALPVFVLTLIASLLWSPVVWNVLADLTGIVVIAGMVMNILSARWFRKSTALSNRMIAMSEEQIRRLRR